MWRALRKVSGLVPWTKLVAVSAIIIIITSSNKQVGIRLLVLAATTFRVCLLEGRQRGQLPAGAICLGNWHWERAGKVSVMGLPEIYQVAKR